jgi:hypothetical protein
LYRYVFNQPIGDTDPLGHMAWFAGAAAGAAVGAVGYTFDAAISGQWSWKDFTWAVVGGAVGGVIPVKAVGAIQEKAVGAVKDGIVNTGTYWATQWSKGETPTIVGTANAGITGTLGGVVDQKKNIKNPIIRNVAAGIISGNQSLDRWSQEKREKRAAEKKVSSKPAC